MESKTMTFAEFIAELERLRDFSANEKEIAERNNNPGQFAYMDGQFIAYQWAVMLAEQLKGVGE